MQRYFIEDKSVDGDKIIIQNEDVHHIRRVMRMKEKDLLVCCLQSGKTALCEIESIDEEKVVVIVKEWEITSRELPVDITIFHGLPKADKLEWVIQKGTELGMKALIPFYAKRSIVKWDTKKQEKKRERWNKIAKEAAEQSYRNFVPTIFTPISFKELSQKLDEFDAVIVAYEETAKKQTHTSLYLEFDQFHPGDNIALIVGPEGGLTEEEVEGFVEKGAKTVSLGPRILRTETAPLYFLAAASYHFEIRR